MNSVADAGAGIWEHTRHDNTTSGVVSLWQQALFGTIIYIAADIDKGSRGEATSRTITMRTVMFFCFSGDAMEKGLQRKRRNDDALHLFRNDDVCGMGKGFDTGF